MVRVISVHHFAEQFVQVVEQPTACTVAPPNRLLLALVSNCVEVRDLDCDTDVLFSFPTVDEVVQIVHCLNGDYVATLETKFNRQNKEINFVRAYINWDSVGAMQQSKMNSSGASLGSTECGMVQPMRARIAGRVTPTTNQSSEVGSLEMIEIPVKKNPECIACCQVSGNLFMLSEQTITIYFFRVKTHDISKMRFVDFEESPLEICSNFKPNHFIVCENYIACYNKENVHLFRVNESNDKKREEAGEEEEDEREINYSNEVLDYGKLLKKEARRSGCREKLTLNLPTIVKDNSIVHRHSPFTFTDKDMMATVNNNCEKSSKTCYKVENLVQLRLVPVVVENAQRQIIEEFKSAVLKPLYIDQNLNNQNSTKSTNLNHFLRSEHSKCLNGIAFVIATQQEGYLYHFDDHNPCPDKDNCLAVYPFTAPVFKIVMEDYFLHALTETGLESYTLRYGHQMCRNFEMVDDIHVACPPVSDPICLVGLRPFLGVEQLLLTDNYLVLLANSETSPAHSVSSNSSSNVSFLTLYSLKLPSHRTVFNDISSVANVHRFTSVTTYRHLISEAHMALRLVLLLKKWILTDDGVRMAVMKESVDAEVVETYRTSCALLGDHYVMENNPESYALAIPYYKMARISPCEVLARVRKIREQSGNQSTKGLLHYLKKLLSDARTPQDSDKLLGPNSKRNFTDTVLELLEQHQYRDLPGLVLRSRIIREYSTEKLLEIFTEKMKEVNTNLSEKNLAIAVLYIQKCNVNKAKDHLEKISNNNLYNLLFDEHELLFETNINKNKIVTTFSELTVTLVGLCPDLLSALFVDLMVDKKVVGIHKMVKIFLEYLPSSIGTNSTSAGIVLQKMLEKYFEKYFSSPENVDLNKIMYEKGMPEALRLLVRSYLSQLQIRQLKEKSIKKENNCATKSVEQPPENRNLMSDCDDDTNKDRDQEKLHRPQTAIIDNARPPTKPPYLFSDRRHSYLDRMPPFQVEITSKLYEVCLEDYKPKEVCQPDEEGDLILKRLQALLCANVAPKQVLGEVEGFLALNEGLRGALSLRTIMASTNDGVLLLIEECPQCLLQFGKDRFTRTDEWKFLIATVQRRILRLCQNKDLKRICFFHKKLLNDILCHVSSSMPLDQLIQVFPQRFSEPSNVEENDNLKSECLEENVLNEIQNYEPYVTMCRETMHADQMKRLIEATGKQLLKTLNFLD